MEARPRPYSGSADCLFWTKRSSDVEPGLTLSAIRYDGSAWDLGSTAANDFIANQNKKDEVTLRIEPVQTPN
jgi:hypothetical protein